MWVCQITWCVSELLLAVPCAAAVQSPKCIASIYRCLERCQGTNQRFRTQISRIAYSVVLKPAQGTLMDGYHM